jgi:hypothetical protein
MRIKDYPYGQPTKTLKKAVTWLNRNKNRLTKSYLIDGDSADFDYPDYFGMPKTISCRFNTDEVDWLQSEISDWKFRLTVERFSVSF